MPSRSSPERRDKVKNVRLRQGFGATVFALALPRERRLEPSPFTPLLSLTADFQQKWKLKILISPGTNPLQFLFDIRLTGQARPDAICCFLQGYGPWIDTFLPSDDFHETWGPVPPRCGQCPSRVSALSHRLFFREVLSHLTQSFSLCFRLSVSESRPFRSCSPLGATDMSAEIRKEIQLEIAHSKDIGGWFILDDRRPI